MEIAELAKELPIPALALVVIYLLLRPITARVPKVFQEIAEKMGKHDVRQTEQHKAMVEATKALTDKINGGA